MREAANGEPLVKGKAVTGFSNIEEEAVHLTSIVPFSREDELKKLGGKYSSRSHWESYVQQDGLLITGQNPVLFEEVAKLILKTLLEK